MDHPIRTQPLNLLGQIGDLLRRNASWLLGLALALLLLQDIFGTHGVVATRRAQQEAVQVQREIGQMDEENQRLQDSVRALKSDPTAIERIAREEMGLARPGEHIFKISPRSGNPANTDAPSPQKPNN